MNKELKNKKVEALKEAISRMIINHPDEYMQWCLLQAPIKVVGDSSSGCATACAASDGYIYINTGFWNEINDKIKAHYKDRENFVAAVIRELTVILFHESLHLMFGHTEAYKLIESTAKLRELPKELCWSIANICMDYIVNSFCKLYYENSLLLSYSANGESYSVGEHNILQVLNSVGVKASELPIFIKKPYEWRWDELFKLCLDNLNLEVDIDCKIDSQKGKGCNKGKSNNSKGKTSYNKNKFDGDKGSKDQSSSDGYSEKDKPEKGSNENYGDDNENSQNPDKEDLNTSVQGVHGTKIEGGEICREGFMQDKESSEQEVKKACEEFLNNFVNELKSVGNTEGNLIIAFDKTVIEKVPWEDVIKVAVQTVVHSNRVYTSWNTINRKYSDWPGRKFFSVKTFWILGDVSASMSKEEIQKIAGVALSATEVEGGSVKVILWDTKVRSVIDVKTPQDIQSVEAGGGTLILPALRYLFKNIDIGDIVAVVTDSEIGDNINEVNEYLGNICNITGNKVLWVHVGRKTDIVLGELDKSYITIYEKREFALN